MLNKGDACPLCAEGRLDCRAPKHATTIGGITVTDRTAMVLVCGACGETLVSAEQRRAYERRAAATILRERATDVPGAVVRVARKSLGLTQKDLAAVLHVAAETVCRWETNTAPLPRASALALVAILDGVGNGTFDLDAALEVARASHPPAPPTELEVPRELTRGAA